MDVAKLVAVDVLVLCESLLRLSSPPGEAMADMEAVEMVRKRPKQDR